MTGRVGRLTVLVAAAALTVVAIGAGVTGTLAAFTDTATVTAGASAGTAFTSGSVATPATPTVTQQTGSGDTAVSWTATTVTTGAGATTATTYDVLRYTAASGGTVTTVCSAVSGTTCSVTTSPGTFHYAVRARFQTSWVNEGARASFAADTTAPTIGLTSPANGYSGSATALRGSITCAGSVPACGTTAGAATSVQYTLRRNRTSTTVDDCWSGSAWVATTAACTLASTTGTTASWTVPGSRTTAFVNSQPGTFTLVLRAADTYGNAATSTFTFTATS